MHCIERKQQRLKEYKKFLNRKFKGIETKMSPNGQFYVSDSNGRNLIGNKYPDLALADAIFTAYKNAYIVEHWNRMEARQVKGIRKDIQNNTVQGGEGLAKAIHEYFEDDFEMYDEENLYE